MKNFTIFLLYFLLGIFLISSFREVRRILNSQQLKTPLADSSFSLEVAPMKSLRGTIVSLSGDVSWQSRIATEPARITKPIQIQQGEEIKTEEKGQANVVFANIASIRIHPKTKINFIQTLPTDILIGQDSGIAEYIKQNNHSISVKSLDLLIKINFGNIIASVSETQPYIIIDVKNGSITIAYNDIKYLTQALNVTGNKRLIFRTDTKRVSVLPI